MSPQPLGRQSVRDLGILGQFHLLCMEFVKYFATFNLDPNYMILTPQLHDPDPPPPPPPQWPSQINSALSEVTL